MSRRPASGFTLIEALVALAILGLTGLAVLPAFMTHLDANTRSERRSDAIGAVQQRMEWLRLQDPDEMPMGSPPESEIVTIGDREYEVRTHYCLRSEYCPPDSPGSRHLTVEIYFEGRKIYDVETVYTQLL